LVLGKLGTYIGAQSCEDQSAVRYLLCTAVTTVEVGKM
jgi:hypothetical protein